MDYCNITVTQHALNKRVTRSESAREWRIVFYKAINGECVVFYKAVSEKYCFKKQLCYANNIGDAQVRF